MAGESKAVVKPLRVVAHTASQVLELVFDDQRRYELPFEFLRVYSPSAEVRGHGPGQAVLQVGKRGVGVVAIEPVGHYAIRVCFSDGHDTGLYAWDYLYHLGLEQDSLWQNYLDRLAQAGASRNPAPVPEGGL